MQTLNYCVQCTDRTSGNVGTFAYDYERCSNGEGFHAVSPVFNGLIEFFQWADKEGWKEKGAYSFQMEKE